MTSLEPVASDRRPKVPRCLKCGPCGYVCRWERDGRRILATCGRCGGSLAVLGPLRPSRAS